MRIYPVCRAYGAIRGNTGIETLQVSLSLCYSLTEPRVHIIDVAATSVLLNAKSLGMPPNAQRCGGYKDPCYV